MRTLLLSLLALPLLGADTITFTPSPTAGVTNYSIYYGPHPLRSSTNRVHIGVATSWPITGIPPAQPTFLFATAWTNGVESLPSNEVLWTNKNFAPTIQINMILEKGPSPAGPYLPLTNQLTYFAATEGSEYFRVRMEAVTTSGQ